MLFPLDPLTWSFLVCTMKLALPCLYCERETEWVDLESRRFFCDVACRSYYYQFQESQKECRTDEVIHSTREIRKMPRHMVCPIDASQRCHILGLNAAKIIFNYYAQHECLRIDDETLEALIMSINARDNLYCCSKEQNTRDKETEKLFLDAFLYRRVAYKTLTSEARAMYSAMQRIFHAIQEHLGEAHHSAVIDAILNDFASVEL